MARYIRFSESLLSEIRERTDLVALIQRDIPLRKTGKSFTGRCPFHEEKTGSFNVSPVRGTYKCFGCDARGDAIAWLVNHHGQTFKEAVLQLASECGVLIPDDDQPGCDDGSGSRREQMRQALVDALRIYRSLLDQNQAAREYLTNERSLADETIARFELGMVGRSILEQLTERYSKDLLSDAGLVIQADTGRTYDRLRERVIVPIYDHRSQLIGFAGRAFKDTSGKAPKYLNSPETELFHKGEHLYALNLAKASIRKAQHAIVVEGYFDVIALHQAGDDRVVAPMGTALTNSQARLLCSNAQTITFAFDGDKAGRSAALRAAAVMLEEISDEKAVHFLFLPDNLDPDDFIRGYGLEHWQAALNNAIPLSAFLNSFVSHGLDHDIPETQVKAACKAKPILARIRQAPLFKAALTARFEKSIRLSLQA